MTRDAWKEPAWVLSVGVVFLVAMSLYQRSIHFSLVVSDAITWIEWSHRWWRIANDYHLPLYPFVIWLSRLVTGGLVDDSALLQLSNIILWAVGVFYAHRTFHLHAPGASFWCLILYSLYPFVGMSGFNTPSQDCLAVTLMTAATYYYFCHQWFRYTVVIGLALLSHKGVWLFAGGLSVLAIARDGYPISLCLLSGLPLGLYWALGAIASGTPLWMLTHHLDLQVQKNRDFMLFDTILSAFLSGQGTKIVKGSILSVLLLGSAILTIMGIRSKRYFHVVLAGPILFLLVVLNGFESWSALRFSKLMTLALPLAVSPSLAVTLNQGKFVIGMGALLMATQVLWVFYVMWYQGGFS